MDKLQVSGEEEEEHLLACSVVFSHSFRGVLSLRPIKEQSVFIEQHSHYLSLALLITVRINMSE